VAGAAIASTAAATSALPIVIGISPVKAQAQNCLDLVSFVRITTQLNSRGMLDLAPVHGLRPSCIFRLCADEFLVMSQSKAILSCSKARSSFLQRRLIPLRRRLQPKRNGVPFSFVNVVRGQAIFHPLADVTTEVLSTLGRGFLGLLKPRVL